jgi:hypothetical protein
MFKHRTTWEQNRTATFDDHLLKLAHNFEYIPPSLFQKSNFLYSYHEQFLLRTVGNKFFRPFNNTAPTVFLYTIIIIIISFMQGIYTYISETNYVPREYSVAAIPLLLFMVLISLDSVLNLLYFYISTFRSMCTVPNMTAFWSSWTS